MFKKILLALIFCVLAVLGAVLFVPSATRMLANIALDKQHVYLSCLDYRLVAVSRLEISRLCIDSPSASIVLNNGRWALADKQLHIAQVIIRLQQEAGSKQSDKEDKSGNAEFSMPALPAIPRWLPQITVDDIQLNAQALASPLDVSLSQLAPNRFRLQADWQADIVLEQGKVLINIAWKPEDFRPVLSLSNSVAERIPAGLWQSQINSALVLEGNKFSATHQLTTAFDYQQQCLFKVHATGELVVEMDLQNMQASADLSRLPFKVSLSDCPDIPALPATMQPSVLQPDELNLLLAQPLMWQQGRLLIPSAQLTSVNTTTGEQLGFNLDIENFLLNTQDNLSARASVALSANKPGLAELNVDGQLDISQQSEQLAYRLDLTEVALNSDLFEYQAWMFTGLALHASGHLSSADGVNMLANIQAATVGYSPKSSNSSIQAIHLGSDLTVKGAATHSSPLTIQMSNQLSQLKQDLFSAADISNTLNITSNDLKRISGQGDTNIGKLQSVGTALRAMQVEHRFDYQHAPQQLASSHQIHVADGLSANAQLSLHKVDVTVPEQPLLSLNPLVQQRLADVTLTEGHVSAHFVYQFASGEGEGNIALQKGAGQYKEYSLTGLQFQPHIRLNSAGLQLVPTTLTVEKFDAGVDIEHIRLQVVSKDSQPSLQGAYGQLLSGDFRIDNFWLDGRDQLINLVLNKVDMAAIMALQQQSGVQGGGISIQGDLHGDIPLNLLNGKVSIADARVKNMAPGEIKIENNQAFDALKQQQPHISEQLALLEHIQFDHLLADLTMQENGELFADIQIKGINPEQQQPLNFNYTHQQNIYTLLKSLRLTEQVEQQLEKNIHKE